MHLVVHPQVRISFEVTSYDLNEKNFKIKNIRSVSLFYNLEYVFPSLIILKLFLVQIQFE